MGFFKNLWSKLRAGGLGKIQLGSMSKAFQEKIQSMSKKVKGIILLSFALLIALLWVFSYFMRSQSMFPLYGMNQSIQAKDVALVTKTLDKMGVVYEVSDQQIFVSSEEEAMRLRTQLGLEGILPESVQSWELFDNQPFTITDFERKVNLQRAITGNMKKHLELLDDIQKADIVISFGEEKYFQNDQDKFPLTASVVITPSPGSDIATNKKKIRGLRDTVAKGVDRLLPENIVIMDDLGNILTKELEIRVEDENVQLAKEQLEIREQLRMKYYEELKTQLEAVFTEKRFNLQVNLDLDWDVEKAKENLILPITMKEDNPNTPYDDSEVKESIVVSQEKTSEEFKGQGYIPEGPAGIEDQIPPALKEKMDQYNTYTKNQDLQNYEFSKSEKDIIRAPYDIKNVNVSVFLDGVWETVLDNNGFLSVKNGKIERIFHPVTKEQVDQVKDIVAAFVGYKPNRGDQISVQAIQFDRSSEFEKLDKKLIQAQRIKRILYMLVLALTIGSLVFFVLFSLIRYIQRKKRIREEELLRQQEALRMASLEDALDFTSDSLTPEEKAFMELQKDALKAAQDSPEGVARLIQTWIHLDK